MYDDLNEAQAEAVRSNRSRILVRAAPGSGKTRVLTTRVLRLLIDGWHPSEVLAITFTRSAADEMSERVKTQHLQTQGRRVDGRLNVTTFHSWMASTLRSWAPKVKLRPDFTIRDDDDRDRLIKFVGLELGKKWKSTKRLWQENDVRRRYRDHMWASNSVDYDDLESLMGELLCDPVVVRALQERHRHVLIDEYQDTSARQQAILFKLHPHYCFVVCDPAQSIYSFRGADPRVIQEMVDSPQWQVIDLAVNYRSDPEIVQAATNVGQHMTPPGLVQRAGREADFEVEDVCLLCPVLAVDSGESLSFRVAHRALTWSEKHPDDTVAVLAPYWRHLRKVASELDDMGVPYVMEGAKHRVWHTDVAGEVMSAMRLMLNPTDRISARRVVGDPVPGKWSQMLQYYELDGGPLDEWLPGGICYGLDDFDDFVLNAIGQARAHQEKWPVLGVQFIIDALRCRRERGLDLARRALELEPDEPTVLFNVACTFARADLIDEALDMLERGIAQGFGHRQWIERDSDLDSLRDHPRFRALMEQL